MPLWDWNTIELLAANDPGKSVYLRDGTMQLLLAAISIMLDEWQWITDDWDTVEALLGQVTNDIMTNSRIGDIVATANAVLPSFGLACDGSSYERVDYPDLYAALDSAYIDDADNFHVPDLRDKTVLGAGNRSIGDTGGAETHSLAISEMPTHQHSYGKPVPTVDLLGLGAPNPVAIGSPFLPTNTTANGGGGSHNNMQPYHALSYFIVAL